MAGMSGGYVLPNGQIGSLEQLRAAREARDVQAPYTAGQPSAGAARTAQQSANSVSQNTGAAYSVSPTG